MIYHIVHFSKPLVYYLRLYPCIHSFKVSLRFHIQLYRIIFSSSSLCNVSDTFWLAVSFSFPAYSGRKTRALYLPFCCTQLFPTTAFVFEVNNDRIDRKKAIGFIAHFWHHRESGHFAQRAGFPSFCSVYDCHHHGHHCGIAWVLG